MNTSPILLVLALLSFTGATHAQSSLGDKVIEAGHDWLIGHWEATDDDGRTLHQSFAWDLDKHVIAMVTKNPRWEIKGMTGLNPEKEAEAVFVGFSNRGGAVKGRWSKKDGSPMLRIKAMSQDGNAWEGAVVYKKINGTTMEVQLFGVDDNGQLKESVETTLTYRKK